MHTHTLYLGARKMTILETSKEEQPKRSTEQAAREDADSLMCRYSQVVEGTIDKMTAVFVVGPHDLVHEYWLEGLGVNPEDLPVLPKENAEFTLELSENTMKCSIFVQPDGTPHTFIYNVQNNL